MEAVWTRYFPISIKIRDLVKSGEIGDVARVFADFSVNLDASDGKFTCDDSDRIINPQLAGGALLDLGICSLTWVFQILYHAQAEKEQPTIVSAINRCHLGTDVNTAVVVHFPRSRSMGTATTSLLTETDVGKKGSAGPSVRIHGTRGEIRVFGKPCRPLSYRVINPDGTVDTAEYPIPTDDARGRCGWGMYWEADECARCLRDGRKESETMPLGESIVIMEVMDTALNAGGVSYPDLIATHVYDAQSPRNTGKRSQG